LKGRRWLAILVGIARKDHQVGFFCYGGIDYGVQCLEEIQHAIGKTTLRIAFAVCGNIDVGISK